MFDVLYYQKLNEERPAEDFINSMDVKMEAKIYRNLELLEENGNMLKFPLSSPLEDGIFELRSQVGNDITRILYFFYYENKIILTHGFIKKTDKTPRDEIEKAKDYRKDFFSRTAKEEK